MAEESLEPLVTECPECHTRFRVNEQQLEMARGRVRCGACLSVFVATRHLVFGTESALELEDGDVEQALDELLDELGSADIAALASQQPDALVSDAGQEAEAEAESESPEEVLFDLVAVEEAAEEPEPEEPEPEEPETHSETSSETPPETPSEKADQFDKLLQSFATEDLIDTQYDEAPVRSVRRWWTLPVLAIAVLAVVSQILWFQFDEWSVDTRFRSVYAELCKALDCELPVMRDLSQVVSKNLVVRSHPQTPNVLVVDALIVNEAKFPQPFPTIELRFSSMGGHLVAGQRFRPSEYLVGDLRGFAMFQPLTPVHISLEIKDPGPEAVNYRMAFK